MSGATATVTAVKPKLGKKPLTTFNAIFVKQSTTLNIGSAFQIEGTNVFIPSGIFRRNFPQAKTNTRLKVQFYPWEVDIGRTIWINFVNETYTFSRKGKSINSNLPSKVIKYLAKEMGLKDIVRLKIVLTAI